MRLSPVDARIVEKDEAVCRLVALHDKGFLSSDTLTKLIGSSFRFTLLNFENSTYHLTCFQDNVRIYNDYKSFYGEKGSEYYFDQVKPKKVEGGWLVTHISFKLENSLLYLGIFYCLVYPGFTVASDTKGILNNLVETFRTILYEQFKMERQLKNYHFPAHMLWAHIRKDCFSPVLYARLQ